MGWLSAAIKAGTSLVKQPEAHATKAAKEAAPVSRFLGDAEAISGMAKRVAAGDAAGPHAVALAAVRAKVAKQIDAKASARQLSESAAESWKLGAPIYETERVYLHAFNAAKNKADAYHVLDSVLAHPELTDAIKKGLEKSRTLPGRVVDRRVNDLVKEAEKLWASGSSRYETEKVFASALEVASTKAAAFSVAESAARLPAFDNVVKQALDLGHSLPR